MSYEEIIKILAKKHNIGELACERILDSQFKVVTEIISNKEAKVINLIKLGKFTPIQSVIRKRKRDAEQIKEDGDTNKTDIGGNLQEIV